MNTSLSSSALLHLTPFLVLLMPLLLLLPMLLSPFLHFLCYCCRCSPAPFPAAAVPSYNGYCYLLLLLLLLLRLLLVLQVLEFVLLVLPPRVLHDYHDNHYQPVYLLFLNSGWNLPLPLLLLGIRSTSASVHFFIPAFNNSEVTDPITITRIFKIPSLCKNEVIARMATFGTMTFHLQTAAPPAESATRIGRPSVGHACRGGNALKGRAGETVGHSFGMFRWYGQKSSCTHRPVALTNAFPNNLPKSFRDSKKVSQGRPALTWKTKTIRQLFF